MSSNPWLVTEPEPEQEVVHSPEVGEGPDALGAQRPQEGIPTVDAVDRLSRVAQDRRGPWVIGAHGGAGESTLAAWLGWTAGNQAWPLSDREEHPKGVIVARTSASGLQAARHAVTEWASGAVAFDLLGLVLMGDAPGKLPDPLRAEVRQLSGAVPATWVVKYLPTLRTARAPDETAPAGAARALRSIKKILSEKENS